MCFLHSGSGQRAVKELDGKIVGGCYLRAELDDNGKNIALGDLLKLLHMVLVNLRGLKSP